MRRPRDFRTRGTTRHIRRDLIELAASSDADDDSSGKNAPKAQSRKKASSKKKNANKKGKSKKKGKGKKKNADPSQQKKQEIMQQLKAKMEERRKAGNTSSGDSKTKSGDGSKSNQNNALGKLINPFQAGKDLRQTLGSLTTLGRGLSEETKQKYYLDDRFLDSNNRGGAGAGAASRNTGGASGILSSFSASSFLQDALDAPSYVPEVLVIGATGEVGRLVVRRLLLEGRFQVRVLVRDLYSQTLNLLGTGVSYCQGDLNNIESLEYALTDVDKIVYVAGAPRPDEDDFQTKFQRYLQENDLELKEEDGDDLTEDSSKPHSTIENLEWEQLSSVLEVRSELAEQVDFIGVQNLVSAYQNVRHADYGTSQAAKRSLFKFGSRPEDFNLFTLDDGSETLDSVVDEDSKEDADIDYNYEDNYDYDEEEGDFYDDYGDYEDEYEALLESRGGKDGSVKTQIQWTRNRFGNGVFVGRVPKATSENMVGGEAAIISSRLRSREDPDQGIDLSNGFAGFILRLVSDGNKYEAFVRTGSYETDGIEYVCEFGTDTKRTSLENKSRNRFKTVRLAFENFKPVQTRDVGDATVDGSLVSSFNGADVRYLGFRFRSSSNMSNTKKDKNKSDSFQSFYMALSYVKVYRVQPEPEFIYLSDARIPPVIRSGMVQDRRRLLLTDQKAAELEEEDAEAMTTTLFDEKTLQAMAQTERSPEETYYKYKGEEILKRSGLSYTIIRVAGFNELPTSEASTIDLVQSNSNLVPVSRAEVAQVCVSALMDPSALNKSVYMTKKKAGGNAWEDEDIAQKFEELPSDPPPA